MYLKIYFCDILKHAKLYLHVTVYCSVFIFTDLINDRSKEENILKAKKNVFNCHQSRNVLEISFWFALFCGSTKKSS